MTMKNDAEFEGKLTGQFKIYLRTWRILTEALENLKNLQFKGKLTCAFKNNMKNVANIYRLEKRNSVLESKIAELNKNKSSKQPNRADAAWKLYFTLEINE